MLFGYRNWLNKTIKQLGSFLDRKVIQHAKPNPTNQEENNNQNQNQQKLIFQRWHSSTISKITDHMIIAWLSSVELRIVPRSMFVLDFFLLSISNTQPNKHFSFFLKQVTTTSPPHLHIHLPGDQLLRSWHYDDPQLHRYGHKQWAIKFSTLQTKAIGILSF